MANKSILGRLEAVAVGKTKYFTGLPCKRGHIAERWVSNTGCLDCFRPIRLVQREFGGVMQVQPLLWAATTADPVRVASLTAYLQDCVKAFDHAQGSKLPDSVYMDPQPKIRA